MKNKKKYEKLALLEEEAETIYENKNKTEDKINDFYLYINENY